MNVHTNLIMCIHILYKFVQTISYDKQIHLHKFKCYMILYVHISINLQLADKTKNSQFLKKGTPIEA